MSRDIWNRWHRMRGGSFVKIYRQRERGQSFRKCAERIFGSFFGEKDKNTENMTKNIKISFKIVLL